MEGKVILKWIAVPFAAVGACMLATAIFRLGQYLSFGYVLSFGGSNPEAPVVSIIQIITHIAGDFVGGIGFVFGGVSVAPHAKRTVGIVLATIATIFSILALLMAYFVTQDLTVVETLGMIASASGAIWFAYQNETE